MPIPDQQGVKWFRSTRCSNGPTCIEVAFLDGRVAVRDSKAPVSNFVFGPSQWRSFIAIATDPS